MCGYSTRCRRARASSRSRSRSCARSAKSARRSIRRSICKPCSSTIVAKATQLSSTEAGVIYVFDEATREFQLRATYGMTAEMIAVIKDHHADFSEAVSAATQRREPDQVADRATVVSGKRTESSCVLGYRARLVVPLLAADRIVGALVVRRKAPGEFSQEHDRSPSDFRRPVGAGDPECAPVRRDRGQEPPACRWRARTSRSSSPA